MSAYMKKQELEVSVDVGVGRGAATIWRATAPLRALLGRLRR
jgi:N-acetylglutamate synthase/N-acetylornithine aminotransferase